MSNPDNLLIVFIKAPLAGKVKTRLKRHISQAGVLQLYRGMVEDLLSQFEGSEDFSVRIMFSPPEAGQMVRNWLGAHREILPQSTGDLGNKMEQAFAEAFSKGFRRVVLIGSDIPTIDREKIRRAFGKLSNHPVVLGPANDGGYYLIGLRQPHTEIFTGISWSSSAVLAQTIKKIKKLNLNFALVEPETDLDVYQDVKQLWIKLNSNRKAELKYRLPRTYRALQTLLGADENTP